MANLIDQMWYLSVSLHLKYSFSVGEVLAFSTVKPLYISIPLDWDNLAGHRVSVLATRNWPHLGINNRSFADNQCVC